MLTAAEHLREQIDLLEQSRIPEGDEAIERLLAAAFSEVKTVEEIQADKE